MSQRHYCAVNRTNLLLGKPLRYTGIAESMLTVWSLRWKNAYAYKTNVMSEIQIELKGGGGILIKDLPALVLLTLHYILDTTGLHPPPLETS